MADVREKLVRSIDISLNINQVTADLIDEIERYTVNENGKILKFRIQDPESNLNVNLFSRKKHVMLTDEFMNYLRDDPGFEFKLA